MKSFLKKILLFILIPLVIFCPVELLTPVNFFTHRFWEALSIMRFDEVFNGHFYPNQEVKMIEEGDLAHHTKYAVKKDVFWKTDHIGFRNDEIISEPDILFVGDSFIAGAALSQDELLPNKVSRLSHKKVYQAAPIFFNEFVKLYKNNVLGRPKMVIFEAVERNIPIFEKLQPKDFKENPLNPVRSSAFFNNVFVALDRVSKATSYKFLRARVNGSTGGGIQSPIDKRMFFGSGIEAKIEYNDSLINSAVQTILTYKRFCDSIGAGFIFMACPDKETLYFENVPFKEQPSFLKTLDAALKNQHVKTINVLEILNANKHKGLLYHFDDSHWNTAGTDLVAQEVLRQYFDTSALSMSAGDKKSSK